MTDESLKPCPFCGDMDIKPHNLCGGKEILAGKLHVYPDMHWLRCASCEGRGPVMPRYTEAVFAWNTRVAQPVDVAEAARVLLEAEVYPEQYATYGNDRTDRYAKGFCGGVEAFKDALRALTKGGE